MKTNRSNSKWWLAAILLPILSVGVGFLYGVTAPHNESDWFNLRFFFSILAGLFIGCVLCCITAILSLLRNERASGIALVLAIPSLIYIIYFSTMWVQAKKGNERQQMLNEARYKNEKEQMDQIYFWRDKFMTNPSLITNDDFWFGQTNRDDIAKRGLDELIRDQSFKFPSEINEYISKKFPGRAEELLLYRHFSREELITMAKDPKDSRRIRESALRQLVRDKTFDVTDEWKNYVIEQFPDELGILLLDRRFTKSELEALLLNPKVSDDQKHIINEDLYANRYRN